MVLWVKSEWKWGNRSQNACVLRNSNSLSAYFVHYMVAERLHIHYPVLLSQGLCEMYIHLFLADKETGRGLKYFDFCPEFVVTEMEPNLLHLFLQEILCVCSLNHSSLLATKQRTYLPWELLYKWSFGFQVSSLKPFVTHNVAQRPWLFLWKYEQGVQNCQSNKWTLGMCLLPSSYKK